MNWGKVIESSIIMLCVFPQQRDHIEELQRWWTLIYKWFRRWFSISTDRQAGCFNGQYNNLVTWTSAVPSGWFFSNTNNASVKAISLLIYAHIHIQLNPIIRKTQSTWKLYAVKSHTWASNTWSNTWSAFNTPNQLRCPFLRHMSSQATVQEGRFIYFHLFVLV